MKTCNLLEAAKFLHMSPSALRTKVKQGLVKAAKPGKRWVFLESDLVEYLRSEQERVEEQTALSTVVIRCPSTNVGRPIGSGLLLPAANEYASLLKLPIAEKRRSTTIN